MIDFINNLVCSILGHKDDYYVIREYPCERELHFCSRCGKHNEIFLTNIKVDKDEISVY